MKKLSLVIITVLSISYSCAVCGFTIKHLWNWFIPATFNLPYLTMKIAMGISILSTFIIARPAKIDETKTKAELFASSCGFITALALLSLAMGYVVKSWV